MESKRAKVIMLKTNPIQDENALIWKEHWEDGKLFVDNSPNAKRPRLERFCDCISQHLYFITDDEIKEGDWYYQAIGNDIKKCKTRFLESYTSGHYKKIVATTDPSLKINKFDSGVFKKLEYSLPEPSKAFIEKYCKLGGIDEVEIEMVITGKCEDPMVCLRGCSIKDGSCKHLINKEEIIKINSYNEITIHPIKNNWNREEVEEIVNLYEAIIHGNDHVMTFEDMQKRIKEIIQ